MVTGEGADEVLAGYDLFREARVRLFWSRDPGSAKRTRAAELLYPWMARSPGRMPAFARSFFGRHLDPGDPALSHRPRWDSTSVIKNMLSADLQDRDRPRRRRGCRRDDAARQQGLGSAEPGSVAGDDDAACWLHPRLPGRPDAHGQLRGGAVPVPRHRNVVDFANALPARHKLFGLEEKYLLKRAFADLVPDDIIHRPKQPYRAPDAASFFAAQPVPPGSVRSCRSGPSQRPACSSHRWWPACWPSAGGAGGENMSNTDNMRVLAVVSTQLTYESFIAGGGQGARRNGPFPTPQSPSILLLMIRSMP